MSIHFISGKPGGGKTMYGVKLILDELINGNRIVVTNTPLLLGRLNEFLQEKFESRYIQQKMAAAVAFSDGIGSPLHNGERNWVNDMASHITARVILIDEDDLPKFFTFRGAGVRLGSVSNVEWKSGKRPDFSPVTDHGILYVLDEVHIAFNARAWADTGAEVLYYLSQHRKLGDDVVCITQSIGNVDKQFRSVAQDFTYIRNLSKQKVGLFRLPAIFTRNTYAQPATDTSKPMESGTFKLDVSGLASLYDTAKGVGIHGRAGADTSHRKKGFSWIWVCVGLAALGIALVLLPKILSKIFKSTPAAVVSQTTKETEKRVESSAHGPATLAAFESSLARHSEETISSNLFCVGYSLLEGRPRAFMSNGDVIEPADGLEMVTKRSVVINGRSYPVKSRPMPEYVPAPSVAVYAPPPPAPVVSSGHVDVTVIGDGAASRHAPPSLGGFGTMSHSQSQQR